MTRRKSCLGKRKKGRRIYMAVRTIIFRGKRIDNGEWAHSTHIVIFVVRH